MVTLDVTTKLRCYKRDPDGHLIEVDQTPWPAIGTSLDRQLTRKRHPLTDGVPERVTIPRAIRKRFAPMRISVSATKRDLDDAWGRVLSSARCSRGVPPDAGAALLPMQLLRRARWALTSGLREKRSSASAGSLASVESAWSPTRWCALRRRPEQSGRPLTGPSRRTSRPVPTPTQVLSAGASPSASPSRPRQARAAPRHSRSQPGVCESATRR